MEGKMGVRKDAGELLKYVYDKHNGGQEIDNISIEAVISATGWEATRVGNAMEYLDKLGAIKTTTVVGTKYPIEIHELTPFGIDLIENKDKFRTTFGIDV